MTRLTKTILIKRRQGAPLLDTVYNETRNNLKKVPLQNPGEKHADYYKRLIKSVYPAGEGTRYAAFLHGIHYGVRAISKEKKARTIFGNLTNRISFVLVKPEFVPFTPRVRHYLRQLGCKVIYSKFTQLSKKQVWLYLHKYVRDFPEIATESAIQVHGPSKVLVIQFPPISTLEGKARSMGLELNEKAREILKRGDVTEFFCKIVKGSMGVPQHGTIRREVVMPVVKELGFEKMRGFSKKLDLGDYFAQKIKEGLNIHHVFAGVHAPDDRADCVREATIFLDNQDFKKIRMALDK